MYVCTEYLIFDFRPFSDDNKEWLKLTEEKNKIGDDDDDNDDDDDDSYENDDDGADDDYDDGDMVLLFFISLIVLHKEIIMHLHARLRKVSVHRGLGFIIAVHMIVYIALVTEYLYG